MKGRKGGRSCCFDKAQYAGRNVLERTFLRLKQFRAVPGIGQFGINKALEEMTCVKHALVRGFAGVGQRLRAGIVCAVRVGGTPRRGAPDGGARIC